MKFQFNEGDKSKAICPECEMVVETTFKYVDTMLVSVCDICGEVVGIPHTQPK
jgi:hypothetical protein